MNISINDRIGALYEHSGEKSIRKFALKIGVAPTTLNECIKGSEPRFSLLESIVNGCPFVSLEWLLTGKGEMQKKDFLKKNDTLYHLTSDYNGFINILKGLKINTMNAKTKVERVNKLIGYLIFTGKLSIHSLQKTISETLKANKVSVSRALKGDEGYLTDSFIERLNSGFENPFELDWLLLKSDGNMLRNAHIGHTTNGDYSPITGNIEVNNCPNELEKALLKIEYLEKTLKDKEEIIELLKTKKTTI
jgi:hypothetical protein